MLFQTFQLRFSEEYKYGCLKSLLSVVTVMLVISVISGSCYACYQ